MSVAEHKSHSPARVACVVITVSDTRTLETETSGRAIADLLTAAGHTVLHREVVRDDPAEVSRAVQDGLRRPGVAAVITTGGTGIARRDSTYEALTRLFDKQLDG